MSLPNSQKYSNILELIDNLFGWAKNAIRRCKKVYPHCIFLLDTIIDNEIDFFFFSTKSKRKKNFPKINSP